MGSYRNYKFRIRECADTEAYLEMLDNFIKVLEREGVIEYMESD